MIKINDIQAAKAKVVEMTQAQARYGNQTIKLQQNNPGLYALGQFLADNDRNQRGIHGTSSGLLVLAIDDNDNNADIIKGLADYIGERNTAEQNIQDTEEKIDESKVTRDENNIIKLSEALYALAFVKQGRANTEKYRDELSRKILDAKLNPNGLESWDYFIDSVASNTIEILPTAYAILALEENGHTCTKAKELLLKEISNNEIDDPSTLAKFIFSLYVLIRRDKFLEKDKEYEIVLKKIWNSPYCTLNDDYEQNIAYWYKTQHEYVRIPWQMYLLTILSKISKYRFYTVNANKRLRSLIDNAKISGFKYHHSGSYYSTRTNGILYSCLVYIQDNLEKGYWHTPLLWIDSLRQFFGKKMFKIIAILIAISIAGYSVYKWISSNTSPDWSDLAPEFIGAVVIGVILLGKKK